MGLVIYKHMQAMAVHSKGKALAERHIYVCVCESRNDDPAFTVHSPKICDNTKKRTHKNFVMTDIVQINVNFFSNLTQAE